MVDKARRELVGLGLPVGVIEILKEQDPLSASTLHTPPPFLKIRESHRWDTALQPLPLGKRGILHGFRGLEPSVVKPFGWEVQDVLVVPVVLVESVGVLDALVDEEIAHALHD